jgi:hypothetical protein
MHSLWCRSEGLNIDLFILLKTPLALMTKNVAGTRKQRGAGGEDQSADDSASQG